MLLVTGAQAVTYLDDAEIRAKGYEPTANGWRPTNPLLDPVDGVQLTPLTDVKMRRPKFLFEDRIPLGALALIAGVPGQGKSTLSTWLGARVSRGQLPGDLFGDPSDVVIATAEDALSFVLAPRFVAAGADLARVHAITVHRDGLDLGIEIPDDLVGIGEAIERTGARLLVVDPLMAFIPTRIDGYKDQHVRVALAPLAKLAEDLDIAVVGIMHLNKREAVDLFSRIGGSGGFLAAARSALLVAPDPNDETTRVIAHGKSNLAPEAVSLRFRLQGQDLPNPDPLDENPITVASVVMLGETDVGVEGLLRREQGAAKNEATAWLAQALSAGPMPVEWIKKSAQDAGHAWRTVERAKGDLGVVSDRVGGLAGHGRWEWRL